MKNKPVKHLLMMTFVLVTSVGHVNAGVMMSPQASTRTHEQNYRDMVLANCIATAYTNENNAAMDAGSTVSALKDWTSYDLGKSPTAVSSLIKSYLARDYQNPLAESELKGVRFDLLKCLDLYHSKELESLVKRVVIDPWRSDRQADPTQPKVR